MISGREALLGVEQAIFGLRSDEGRLDAALASAKEDAARARQAEADGFRALAAVRLDQIMSVQIAGELDQTSKQVLDLMAGERVRLAALDKKRSDNLAAQTEAANAKRDSGLALSAVISAVEAKHRDVAQALTSTDEWRQAQAAVDEARRIADAAADKAKRAADELSQKRQPYEADPLFMYLWQRRHGTGEDRSGFFARFFDRRIARLIDYDSARANYAMLLTIPARLAEHAGSRRQAIEEAEGAKAALERRELVAAGIEKLESDLVAAQARDQAAQARSDELVKSAASLEAERAALHQNEDGGRGAALSLLADRLSRADMRQLYADAFKTPTPDDENALNAITRARQQIATADKSLADIRARIVEMARRRQELETARDNARSQGYDSPWGNFANHVLLSDIIRGVVAGALSASDLGRAMAGEYRRRDPGFGSNWGGGFNPSSGQSPWGGGSSSPPSSQGGGWRTTDSF